MKQEFTDIYKNHLWGDGVNEPLSGVGSNLFYTENIVKELPIFLRKFRIQSMYDAACGDFTWMPLVLKQCPTLVYMGGDVVDDVIEMNIKKHPEFHFTTLDMTKDPLPSLDLVFARDVLMHLPEQYIQDFLDNFRRSEAKYLMATTYLFSTIGYWGNKYDGNFDIPIGGFRAVNLFDEPYNLPAEIIYRIKDYVPGHPERELCVWSREQLL